MSDHSADHLVQQLFAEHGSAVVERKPDPNVDLTIRAGELRAIVERLSLVVPTRDVMPVLKHIRIDTAGQWPVSRDDQLVFTATDMELTLRTSTRSAMVSTPGSVVVPARRLLDILKSVPGDLDVRIIVVAQQMTVWCGRTRWTVQVPTGADFPTFVMVGLDDTVRVTLSMSAFTEAIDRVRYAAAGVDHPALAAVRIGDMFIAAADGNRFAMTAFRIELPRDLVLPIAAVDRVVKLATAAAVTGTDEMTLGDYGRHIGMEIGNDVFLVAKPAHPYPDLSATTLRPVMANRHELTLDRDELRAALRRVALAADNDTRGVALLIRTGGVELVSRDGHGNEASHELTAGWTGPARTVTVNATHLSDLIARYSQPQLTLRLGEDTKTRRDPVLVKDTETETVGAIPQMHLPWAS